MARKKTEKQFSEDPEAQQAAKLGAIQAQNAECRRLQLAHGAAKEHAKVCREAYQDSCDALHNLIAGTPQGELFAQASKEMDGDE